MRRSSRFFWSGFASGAAAASGGFVAVSVWRRYRHSTVAVDQIEHSTQIGRSVDEVFEYFERPDKLADLVPELETVRVFGDYQTWRARVDGLPISWDAQVTQFIPNQAIGWKSVDGPKHSGRVTFAPLGDNTEVHVVMNYAAPVWIRWFNVPAARASRAVENGLAHLKQALERKGFDTKGTADRVPPDAIAGPQPSVSSKKDKGKTA